MPDELEEVVRVGLAGWVGQSDEDGDEPPYLGMIGDDADLYLLEIDAGNRARLLPELIDHCEVDDRGLRVELVFFGSAGSCFASAIHYLQHWPKSAADVPAEVFIDTHYKASFTSTGDEIAVSVWNALRPGGPPKRRFRIRADSYEQAIGELAREARRLRDELIAIAQQRAPEKVAALQSVFRHWPA